MKTFVQYGENVTTWTDLINKLQTLDDLAKKIQSEPNILPRQTTTKDEIDAFRAEYQEWYTDCLSRLEGELKNQFQLVYEAFAKPFILHPNDFYKKGEKYSSYTYPRNQFKNRYPYYFQKAAFDHKTILLRASKMQYMSTLRTQGEAIEIIKSLATNFHLCVHYLNTRHDGRPPFLTIVDEFDVQDIFHGLLRLFFKDIRTEEGASSHAGKNSRIDFFLTQEQIIVETKKTRANLKRKEVGEELTLDIIYYKKHLGYNTFIGFVYDPDKYIKNPDGLANDLQQTINDMKIIIIINQS